MDQTIEHRTIASPENEEICIGEQTSGCDEFDNTAAEIDQLAFTILELEKDLDSIDRHEEDFDEQVETAEIEPFVPPGWHRFIDQQTQKMAQWREENKESLYAKFREDARKEYAFEKACAGESVRTYRRGMPSLPGETRGDRRRRIDREYQRAKAGKNAATVRPYTDLRAMSDEERSAHIRRQTTERKRRQRARAAAEPSFVGSKG